MAAQEKKRGTKDRSKAQKRETKKKQQTKTPVKKLVWYVSSHSFE